MKQTTLQDLFTELNVNRGRIELAFDRMCGSVAMHPQTWYASCDEQKAVVMDGLTYLDLLDHDEGIEAQRHLVLDAKLDEGVLYYNMNPLPVGGLVEAYEVLTSCSCGDPPVYPLWILAPETAFESIE